MKQVDNPQETNRAIVVGFYELAFNQHKPTEAAKKYIGDKYIQHNPYVPNGAEAFYTYFEAYFKEHPKSHVVFSHVLADGDLVVLHLNSKADEKDRGRAVVDIFRVENGTIVEHWDVIQEVPETTANGNSMFKEMEFTFMSHQKSEQPNANIQITKDGPYLVSGDLPLSEQHIVTNAEGESLDYREGKKYPSQSQYALCRCGQSANKPFCDGTHKKVKFDGTETASHQPYLKQAETIEGPTMMLTDQENLCAFARFCDPKGRIWNLVTQTDNPEAQELVKHEAGHCPSGRLVAWDRKTGKPIEPKYEPSLGLIEDTARQVRGPVWVRGGIPVISADGKTYEIRNQMTLCRCGRSDNKPFCNGSHAA